MLDSSGSRIFRYLYTLMQYGMDRGLFKPADPKTLAEVVWTSFLGVVHLENSKHAMARKDHRQLTWNLAAKVLKEGILA
jgi:hypothetical protein